MTAEDPELLTNWFAAVTGARSVRIVSSSRLDGGAIQDNRFLDLDFDGGNLNGRQSLVLRRSNPGTVQASHDRATEFALLKAAFAAGVTVPEPLFLCTDEAVVGGEFFVMRDIPGIGLGPRIVKDKTLGGDREQLANQLAIELSRIHQIVPGTAGLEVLGPPPTDPASSLIDMYRKWLDALGARRPVLEWAVHWLKLNAPVASDIVLCHRDFRTGNYLVDDSGLTGVLDWEFAGWGDPLEDLGWFCCRFWRFGATHLEAGGLVSRAQFCRSYSLASGRSINPEHFRYYEVMANLRWAVIALQQCQRFVSGAESSLELALTGRRVPEMEIEILKLTGTPV